MSGMLVLFLPPFLPLCLFLDLKSWYYHLLFIITQVNFSTHILCDVTTGEMVSSTHARRVLGSVSPNSREMERVTVLIMSRYTAYSLRNWGGADYHSSVLCYTVLLCGLFTYICRKRHPLGKDTPIERLDNLISPIFIFPFSTTSFPHFQLSRPCLHLLSPFCPLLTFTHLYVHCLLNFTATAANKVCDPLH